MNDFFRFGFRSVALLDNSIDNQRCLHSCVGAMMNDFSPESVTSLRDLDEPFFFGGRMAWFLGGIIFLDKNEFYVKAFIPSPFCWYSLKTEGMIVIDSETRDVLFQIYGADSVERTVRAYRSSSERLEIIHERISIADITNAMGLGYDFCIAGLDANVLYGGKNRCGKSGHYVMVTSFSNTEATYLDPNFIGKGKITVSTEMFIRAMDSINGFGGELILVSRPCIGKFEPTHASMMLPNFRTKIARD